MAAVLAEAPLRVAQAAHGPVAVVAVLAQQVGVAHAMPAVMVPASGLVTVITGFANVMSIAPLWPSYHLARLAQWQVGFAEGAMPWLHAGVLLCIAALFLFLARRRLAAS